MDRNAIVGGLADLPRWLRDGLKAEASRQGRAYSALCREVLERYLEEGEEHNDRRANTCSLRTHIGE